MKNLLGIKNNNSHPERSEESQVNVCHYEEQSDVVISLNNAIATPSARNDKNNCHSELTRKSVELAKPDFLFLLGDSESINLMDNKELALIDSGSESGMTRGKYCNHPTPPLPVQGGSKFAKAGFTLAGATHVGLPPVIAKAGFTLAEVLITLGIIGVVAAMTIPNLMTAYQKQQTEARLKQAYSVLGNAIRLSEAENGTLISPVDLSSNDVYTHDVHEFFAENIAPFLNGATRITSESMDDRWYVYNSAGISLNGSNILRFGQGSHCINSGLCFRMVNHYSNYWYIFVDINGPSKPNRLGRDVFCFALHFNDSGAVLDGLTYSLTQTTSISEIYSKYCNKTGTDWSNGIGCTEIIKRNSWKIPKDYPW